MARIYEEIITIKISTLVKDNNENETTLVTDEIVDTLEEAVSTLVGNEHVVEVVKAQ